MAKATLKLFVRTVRAPGALNVHRVIGAWAEDTVTPATQPALGVIEGSVGVTSSDENE